MALYGAWLSTYTAWTTWKENRAKIRVTLQLAIATMPAVFDGCAIRIGAANHGFTDVHFDTFSAGVQVKGLDMTFIISHPPGNPLPRTLAHGEELTALGERQALNDEIKELKAPGRHKVRGIGNALNRVYRSKWKKMGVR